VPATKDPHDQKATMLSKLTTALFTLIVGAVVLAPIASVVDQLISALTPLVLVIGVIAIALRLTDYYTRR
jgi:hypothetical protein